MVVCFCIHVYKIVLVNRVLDISEQCVQGQGAGRLGEQQSTRRRFSCLSLNLKLKNDETWFHVLNLVHCWWE